MMDHLQEILEALAAAKKEIEEIDLGSGSKHFRHGRETMREDAAMTIDSIMDRITDPANQRY